MKETAAIFVHVPIYDWNEIKKLADAQVELSENQDAYIHRRLKQVIVKMADKIETKFNHTFPNKEIADAMRKSAGSLAIDILSECHTPQDLTNQTTQTPNPA